MALCEELRHNSVVKISTDDLKTRDAVARSILENGPSTAAVVSERLGLTPAGIRRHLDNLVAEGILEAREPKIAITQGRGRPSKVFVMTDAGRQKFEHSYDDLAVAALKFMAARDGESSIEAFARYRADDLIKKATPLLTTSKNRSETLAEFLSDQGYATTITKKEKGEELCQHHCPIAHVASEFPQLCEAETEALSQLLGSHVQRLATIAHGDGVCTTYIPQLPQSKQPTPTKKRAK